MTTDTSDETLKQAMYACASEPVHIPGLVQPFACLIGVDAGSEKIVYASENCPDFTGVSAEKLLGINVRELLGRDIVHSINNAAARGNFSVGLTEIGQYGLGGNDVEIAAFSSGHYIVIQIEHAKDPGLGGGDAIGVLSQLMEQIQTSRDHAKLFDLTTRMLRHLSGYDRVMIYKFDPQYNGEVVAEARSPSMESFVGLRFPQWDIPAQARAIMAKLRLRFIEDVDQTPVPLIAEDKSLPPLDITYASCRGVSAVHMQYLRNMGVKSTLTLSIVFEDKLWGIISFHHRRPRVPAPKLRDVLTAFGGLFATKLEAMEKQARLDLAKKMDQIKDKVLIDIEENETMEEAMPQIGPVIEEVMGSVGIALLTGSQTVSYGRVPEQALLAELLREVQSQPGTPIISDNLASSYPEMKDLLNGCAGVFATAINPNRSLCIFRAEQSQSVKWAGSPDKTIEVVSGNARLSPRASFSVYLQDVEGHSAPWTEQDIYFADRIWVLINSAERKSLKNTLNRQQALMINELNHRVRNILALVRSVSRQARRHYGTLESYTVSLENRIQALAAAHDIASGSAVKVVGIKQLISVEMSPFEKDAKVIVTGSDQFLRSDIAPIFSLVIHELATNAAKYGALSVEAGSVEIEIKEVRGGVSIIWREVSGPPVVPPNDRGFGSMLIEQAVPHEMGGTASLKFAPTGVEAELFLPDFILEFDAPTPAQNLDIKSPIEEQPVESYDFESIDGCVLVLEDNFMIAQDMTQQLHDFGLKTVETCSNSEDAFELIEANRPAVAVLDVNLGPGLTSKAVAYRLLEMGVPFVFVTGYGDAAELDQNLHHVPRLTKPVTNSDLQNVIARVLKKQDTSVAE